MIGKRSTVRKIASGAKERPPVEEPQVVTLPLEKPITNPASDAKLDLIEEKTYEAEYVTKLEESSRNRTQIIAQLADRIESLADDAASVAHTQENWDYVFNIMSETNRPGEEPHAQWVRINKSATEEEYNKMVFELQSE